MYSGWIVYIEVVEDDNVNILHSISAVLIINFCFVIIFLFENSMDIKPIVRKTWSIRR